MNRFTELFNQKTKHFIPYFMLGYPTIEKSIDLIKQAIAAGADALELGLPFSDPIADGPTIQKASTKALDNGMHFDAGLEIIAEIRRESAIPIGLMTYYNLIYKHGCQSTLKRIHDSGADGLLCVDILPDDVTFTKTVQQENLATIFLVAPNTDAARIKFIAEQTTGFIYLVSVLGTTGARDQIHPQTLLNVKQLRKLTEKPIVVGFGVSSPTHVQQLHDAGATGVIIASRLNQLLERHPDDESAMLELIKQCSTVSQ